MIEKRRAVTFLLTLALLGCTGAIETTAPHVPAPAGSPEGRQGGAVLPPSTEPATCHASSSLAPARIWRLTDDQYVNAVRDLFGVTIDPEVSGARAAGGTLNLAEVAVINGTTASNYQAAARAAATKIAGTLPALLPCRSAQPDLACVEQFVRARIPRAFRRALTADEIKELMALYQLGLPEGPPAGVRLLLEAVLQSPSFLWRTEVGGAAAPPPGSKVTLTPYELAGALGFSFLDSVPDESLWARAVDGTLTQPRVLAAEVDRLLALPQVRAGLVKKAGQWLGMGKLQAAEKDAKLFAPFTPSVKQALLAAEEQFIGDVLWKGTINELLTSKRMYLNQELASLYGIPGVTGSGLVAVDVTAPERAAGVLSHPALLAAHSSPAKGDVVHRGLFVYEAILCGTQVPPPPPAVVTEIQRLPANATERQAARARADKAGCRGCHALFDPYGLVHGRFDAIGRYRVREANGQPIDQSSNIEGMGAGLDGPIDGLPALASRLVSQRRVADCAVANLATQVLGRDARQDTTCALRAVKDSFARSGSFIDLWKTLATSPGFVTRDVK